MKSAALVVVALVNGMIGGLILVLPIFTTQTGTIQTAIIIVVTGFFSFYSCYLCLIHLGNNKDLDKALYHHFNQSYFVKVLYDLLIFINLVFILLLYFNLIVKQWQGLIQSSILIPLLNAGALFVLVFLLNYFSFGAKLMGYGVVSIFAYCIFLIWVLATAPKGNSKMPYFGKNGVNLAAAMSQGFAVQIFFIPVLRELPDNHNYIKYTLYAYIIGGIVYSWIAFGGAFGIINRIPLKLPLQTIQDFFEQDQLQMSMIQCIYLVHLYSAYGQFLLVCKKRMYSMFNRCGLEQSKHGQMLKPGQIVFTIVAIGVSMGIYFAGVTIKALIQFNGAIIGFFFIYLLPALMHFKCLYYPKRKQIQANQKIFSQIHSKNLQLSQRNQSKGVKPLILVVPQKSLSDNVVVKQRKKTLAKIQAEHPLLHQEQQHKSVRKQKQTGNNLNNRDLTLVVLDSECACKKPAGFIQIFDIISLIGMIALGTFIMVDGLINIITGDY